MTNNGIYSSGGSSAPGRASRAVRVLVVDDDPDTVSTLLTLVREEGFEARGAASGWRALEEIKAFDPDAVLLDIALTDLSGWDVARRIRNTKGRSRPLIIGISGQYKEGADKILAELSGFNHYLLKPYDPNAVLRLLEPLTQTR
jgi:DNA-binding response OmpR family regulator